MTKKDKKQLKKSLIISSEEYFNIFNEICKIQHHIVESNEILNKKSLIEKVSLGLLELKFKSNNLMKTKCLKWVVKKILPKI